MKTYYNTLNFEGREKKKRQESAKSQTNQILKVIQKNSHKILTPRIIWKLYIDEYNEKIFLTSVRRSINSLMKSNNLQYRWDGKTTKTGKKQYVKHYHFCHIDYFDVIERIILLRK